MIRNRPGEHDEQRSERRPPVSPPSGAGADEPDRGGSTTPGRIRAGDGRVQVERHASRVPSLQSMQSMNATVSRKSDRTPRGRRARRRNAGAPQPGRVTPPSRAPVRSLRAARRSSASTGRSAMTTRRAVGRRHGRAQHERVRPVSGRSGDDERAAKPRASATHGGTSRRRRVRAPRRPRDGRPPGSPPRSRSTGRPRATAPDTRSTRFAYLRSIAADACAGVAADLDGRVSAICSTSSTSRRDPRGNVRATVM